jgi:hypothetical protein
MYDAKKSHGNERERISLRALAAIPRPQISNFQFEISTPPRPCCRKMDFYRTNPFQKTRNSLFTNDKRKFKGRSSAKNEPITNPFLGRANPLQTHFEAIPSHIKPNLSRAAESRRSLNHLRKPVQMAAVQIKSCSMVLQANCLQPRNEALTESPVRAADSSPGQERICERAALGKRTTDLAALCEAAREREFDLRLSLPLLPFGMIGPWGVTTTQTNTIVLTHISIS